MMLNRLPPKIILWGGTGQAKVNRPIVEHYGAKVVVVFDDTPGLNSPFSDVPIYRGWDAFEEWFKNHKKSELGFCIAIGNPHGRIRCQLHDQLVREGLSPISLVHPTAFIDKSAVIGEGCQMMAGVIIQPEVQIGKQCIINTRVSIDHECVIEDGVEIAPGAILCGDVHLETNVWIGAGATILPRRRVGQDAIVGAGAVVTEDVPPGVTVIGIPAKQMSRSLQK